MRSMTGYGRRQFQSDGREMTVEVKTVNHRFLDIGFRMPRNLSFLEEPIRIQLSESLKRGHEDVFLNYRNNREDAREVSVDEPLLLAYKHALGRMEAVSETANDIALSHYMALPDVLRVTEREEDREAVTDLMQKTLELVLGDVIAMREKEGEALFKDLEYHLLQVEAMALKISGKAPQVSQFYRERLQARLAELEIAPVEPQRLAQEVALFADRCAVDEELSRLSSHIQQMQSCMKGDGEAGRKLDFLVQELNREVNTIGSKASDAEITNWVVAAKCEVEKLREQVQNIE
jgi:uncharacterized protein (TIGR00255 family)